MRQPIVDILASLGSTNRRSLREAIERAGDLLRANPTDEVLNDALGERLTILARHDSWQIRTAVAEAIQHLRNDAFSDALARLLTDDNEYVRDAAKRSRARRTEQISADILRNQHDELLNAWLSEVEAAPNSRAAVRSARRVAERYVELFVRQARHEIANVIGAIDLTLANVERALAPRQKSLRKNVLTAQACVHHLNAIVDDLRELTAEVTPEFHVEPLRELLEEAVSIAKGRRQLPRIKVSIAVDKRLLVEVHRHRLQQAFRNVVQNAFEAFKPKARGNIEIKAKVRGDDNVLITITDDAGGMSEEVVRNAFGLYTSSKEHGTGFGLPFAKRVIETEHRGFIELTSEESRRTTTVAILLPRTQENREE